MFTPLIIAFCHKHQLYDRLNERKVHSESRMPRLGGVGIAFAFILTIAIIRIFQVDQFHLLYNGYKVWPIVLGASIVFLTGLLDDLIDLRAWMKLVLESTAALMVMLAGYRFKFLLVPFGTGVLDFGVFSYPLTFFWIVGITNAMNLIDGIDGLAGGISALVALAFALFFMFTSNALPAEVCLALVGSIIGFLMFNLPPAKIFMGDSGSLFLGYVLAVVPLLSQYKGFHGPDIGVLSAATALSIPILDTFMAIYRRARAHKSCFSADRKHLHHRLLDKGLRTPEILLLLYSLTIVLGMISLSVVFIPSSWSFVLNIVMFLAMFVYFLRLNQPEKLPDAQDSQ
jgi:UDP-GlcNAc:undecaprenyl-phosphate GlcNAc-1-phosphate transferase